MKKNTKIIATIGPASSNEKMLSYFFDSGVYATRFNFSHGNHSEQLQKLNLVRKVGKAKKSPFTLILDTKGPEIRTQEFDGKVTITKGSFVKIYCNANVLGTSSKFSVTLPSFYKDVKPGNLILVDDGKLQLVCENIINKVVTAKALNSAQLTSRRGVNLPNSKLSLDFLSEKDKSDLLFGCENKFDWVAASFVSSSADVLQIRKFLDNNGGSKIRICSKIESEEALTNIKDIVNVSDAIMIARGDLGIEIPYYLVPYWTLRILQYCRENSKPVVIATQMLESMLTNISPTRAEVSDIYYAGYFGCDSAMLSGESAKGNFPIEAVTVMSRILSEENENSFNIPFENENSELTEKINGYKVSELTFYDAVVLLENDYDAVLKLAALREKFLIIVIKKSTDLCNEYGFIYSVLTLTKKGNFDVIDEAYIKKEVYNTYKINIWTVKILS